MFTFIRKLLGNPTDHPIFAEADLDSSAEFVYVKIPEGLKPMDRGDKYDDPLLAILEARNAGIVTGGGSSLGDEGPDGTRPIEFVGVDVDLTNLASGLPIIREALVQLGAPEGTEIHYTRGSSKLQDSFSGGDWELEQTREFLHPGFGV